MRTPAGSFCKAGVRFFARARRVVLQSRGAPFAHARWVLLQSRSALFCARPPGRFVKQECAFFAHARRVVLQSRDAPFAPDGPPLFPVCPPSARVHPPPAAAHTPSRLSDPCARPLSPGHGSVSSAPACPPPRAPALLFVLPRPHAPALPSVFSVSPARPRHHPFFHPRRSAAFPFRAPSRCARLPLRRRSFPVPFYNSARLLCKKTLSAPPV